MNGFETAAFVEACRAALNDPSPQRAVRELLTEAVSDPAPVVRALGEPTQAGIQKLHVAADLTVINVVWAPRMTLKPHNHAMWANIGVYTGREDNIFWKRADAAAPGRIEAAGAASLCEKDAVPLGRDIIHSVTNPISKFTGAIHIYGGNFFEEPRSEWNPESLLEEPYDVEATLRFFAEENARWTGA